MVNLFFRECVYKMHYLMLAVILVKSVACLFHAVSGSYLADMLFKCVIYFSCIKLAVICLA